MRIPRIHTPQPLAEGDEIELDENAFNHAVRVLRLKTGAALRLFNGEGGEFEARLTEVERRRARAVIGAFHPRECESPLRIELGQCISRGERMDHVVQKSVELGVAAITPLESARCAVRLEGARARKREAHWRAIAIGACEQCGRNRLPELKPLTTLEKWLATVEADLKLLLDPGQARALASLGPAPASVALLVGPEGGLTKEEIELARRHGFIPTLLGPRVLRTETAAVATLAAVQLLWGDLGEREEPTGASKK